MEVHFIVTILHLKKELPAHLPDRVSAEQEYFLYKWIITFWGENVESNIEFDKGITSFRRAELCAFKCGN
jgi:hypothetical protein